MRTIYTIIGQGERKMLANSYAQALSWVESNEKHLLDSEEVILRREGGLVDLTEAIAKAPAPTVQTEPRPEIPDRIKRGAKAKSTRAQAKTAVRSSADDELSNQDAADMLGYTLKKVYNMRYTGKLTAGKRSHVLRSSVEAHLARRDGETRGHPAWAPAPKGTDKMVHEDAAAKQLGLTTDQVREVKRNGRVPGGNGWVNLTVMQAYMNHPAYEPPFATQ